MSIPIADDTFRETDSVVRLADAPEGHEARRLHTLAESWRETVDAARLARVTPTVVVAAGSEGSPSLEDVHRAAAMLASVGERRFVRIRRDGARGVDLALPADSGTWSTLLADAIAEAHALDRTSGDWVTEATAPGGDDRSPWLIQRVTVAIHGERAYPLISGTLLGANPYPISYMSPSDGVAHVVLGLGQAHDTRVDALRFSPTHPDLMPDFSTPADVAKHSQRKFDAFTASATRPNALDLEVAKGDGTLAKVGGVVSWETGTVYPGIRRPGMPVVTFAMMRQGTPFSLPKMLADLHASAASVGVVGFAIAGEPELVIESARDTPTAFSSGVIGGVVDVGVGVADDGIADVDGIDEARVLVRSASALGVGAYAGVRDLVFVTPGEFDIARSRDMSAAIAEANRACRDAGRRYVLIVSGRLGSTDEWLGIPIDWPDIASAAVQVEVALEDFNVDASRGTHFFRQMVVNRIGFVHVSRSGRDDHVAWDRLAALDARERGAGVRHARLDAPLVIRVDGVAGHALIALGSDR